MLEAIRKRKANLDQIERLILEEFGQSGNDERPASKRTRRKKISRRGLRRKNGTSRKDELHAWLKKNGPSSRKEIITGSGLPAGTVTGYLSSEKDLFENRDGKWHAR
jgi:hypothetical protein